MSLWPAIILFGIVFACGWLLCRWFGAPSVTERFETIDGLRGYLAFGVFVHHGAVWYYFLRSGDWAAPPSYLYANLGYASVLLFFMITGFLFWSKVLRARSAPIDWSRLYISRGLRLVPLYLLAVALMTITVAIITRFQLREPISALCRNVFEWTAFSVSGIPDINRLHNTPMIIAKVTWTLPYEWLFYCALPLLAMSVRVSSRRLFIVGSVGAVAWLAYEIHPEIVYLGAFGAGIAAACIVHFNLIQGFSRTRTASLSAAISLLFAFGFFPTAKQILPLALLSLAFAVVAGGNTLFGTLTWPASRFLGQLTYSMYLLHGLVLFWMFRFVIGGHNAVSYSPAQHWLAIAFCIPVLLILCSITFRFIELPAMKSITGVTRFLQTCLTRRSRLQPLPRPSGIPIEAKQTVTPSASRLWN